MNYPSDWPCKQCGKLLKEHCKEGEISPDRSPWIGNWCHSKTTEEEKKEERLFKFTPVDNLTYVELLANGK